MLEIEIAAARWRYFTTADFDLAPPASLYADFVATEQTSTLSPFAPVATNVTFTIDPMPAMDDLTRTFETGATWWLGRRQSERVAVLDPPGSPHGPLWAAVGNADFEAVTVHCNPVLCEEHRGRRTLKQVVQYPLDQFLFIHRMAKASTVLLHSAAVESDGEAILLCGHSGAGKSTSAAMLAGCDGFTAIADDRVAARLTDDETIAFGTPWPGEAGIAQNLSRRVRAICILNQARDTRLARLRPKDALPGVLEVASVPWYEPELRDSALATIDRLLAQTPCFRLDFTREPAALAQTIEALAA